MTAQPFLPLATERLVLRQFTAGDAEAFSAYRSDPEVARYQSWATPFPLDAARHFIEEQAHLDGPIAGDWVQIAVALDGCVIGDVAVRLSEDRHTAQIGYSLARLNQGRGFAAEAVGAVVARLFETGLHRVEASLAAPNVASARLLERIGFRHEGTAVSAALDRDEWCDVAQYAVLRDEHEAWLTRPRDPPATVRLVEITPENHRRVAALTTHRSQERFVATMGQSFGDALFPEIIEGAPVVPWFRAIEADGEIAGFVMLAERTAAHCEAFLWRLLVDRRHQHRGIGSRALGQIVDQLRADGHVSLVTSWHPGAGGPEPFYVQLGFEPTGELDGDEIVARLHL